MTNLAFEAAYEQFIALHKVRSGEDASSEDTDMQQRSEICRMLLQLVIGPHALRMNNPVEAPLSPLDREVLRLACKMSVPIRNCDVRREFKLGYRASHRTLERLVELELLSPLVKGIYIKGYKVNEQASRFL